MWMIIIHSWNTSVAPRRSNGASKMRNIGTCFRSTCFLNVRRSIFGLIHNPSSSCTNKCSPVRLLCYNILNLHNENCTHSLGIFLPWKTLRGLSDIQEPLPHVREEVTPQSHDCRANDLYQRPESGRDRMDGYSLA